MNSGFVRANTTQYRAVALTHKGGTPSDTTTLTACVNAADAWAHVNDTGSGGYWTVPESGLYAINVTLGSLTHPIAPDGTESYGILLAHGLDGANPSGDRDILDLNPDLTSDATTQKYRSVQAEFDAGETIYFFAYGGTADTLIDVVIEIQHMMTGPITSGTAYYYLKALTGSNAGKWYLESDQTWQATETGNPATHQSDGKWTAQINEDAWVDGVQYVEYGKDSEDRHDADNGGVLIAEERNVQPMFDWLYDATNTRLRIEMWLVVDGQRISDADLTDADISIRRWDSTEVYTGSTASFDAAGVAKINVSDPIGTGWLPANSEFFSAEVQITWRGVVYSGLLPAKWQK